MNFLKKHFIIPVTIAFLLFNLALLYFNTTAKPAGIYNPEYVYNGSEYPEKTMYTYDAYPARKIQSPYKNI